MATIKIQINHEKTISTRQLATILYNQIGEVYDIDEEKMKDYFEILSIILLPNDTFVTVLTFELPELPTRDIELKDIVITFLQSVERIEGVINIVKTNDTIFQKMSLEYYEKITIVEMEMRNVLNYILNYDDRRITSDLFKEFGIKVAEDLTAEKIKKNYENGLFYILFKDYKSFLDIEPLNANDITKLLQDSQINSFEEFKSKLRKKINEDRHLGFLASVEKQFSQLDNIRNSIMHIHSLSEGEISNFEKIMNDTEFDKSLLTLINDFWNNEQNELKQKTTLKIIESVIKDIFENSTFEEGKLIITKDFGDDILSEYESLEDLQNDIIAYGNDGLEIDYNLTSEDEIQIKEIVKEYWERLS
ncbi:MAG: hypothetical protein KU38_12060 [Sulfurovum sp. FS08-3]|nr:MAG: hypothetical protein KU38_12060 [Sulfurovum sp. FS08-3]